MQQSKKKEDMTIDEKYELILMNFGAAARNLKAMNSTLQNVSGMHEEILKNVQKVKR